MYLVCKSMSEYLQKLLIYIIKYTPMQKNEKNGGLAMDKNEVKTLVVRID